MTIANLGLAVDSTQADQGTISLTRFAAAAKLAETAADRFGGRASAAARQAANDLGRSVSDVENLASRLNRALNVRTSFGGAERDRDIQAFGQELDRLRARFNPLFAMIAQYKTAQAEIRQAHALGAISSREATLAMERERRATLDSIAAIKGRDQAIRGSARAGGLAGHGAAMAGQQLWDVGITAAAGASLGTIALQQGPQLGLALEQQLGGRGGGALGVVKALGAGLTSLISPLNLIGIGAAVAGGALVQWFSKAEGEAETLEDAVKANSQAILDLGEAYGIAGLKADDFARRSVRGLEAGARESRAALEARTRSEIATFMGAVGSEAAIGRFGRQFVVGREFGAFAGPIAGLNQDLKDGQADWDRFEKQVDAIGRNPAFRTKADELILMIQKIREANGLLETNSRLLSGRGNSVGGPASFDRNQQEFNRLREDQRQARLIEEQVGGNQRQREFDAEQAQMRARTFSDRLAAARLSAQADQSGSPIEREDRERIAIERERTRQEVELRDAVKARSDAQRAALEQYRIEALGIGKTVGEQVRLNAAYQEFVRLREESERTGLPISDDALANVRLFAKALGEAADNAQRLRLRDDLTFQSQQFFRTPQEQAIASRLRGTGIGLDSPEAMQVRQLDRMEEVYDRGMDFWDDFESGLRRGDDFGEAFGDAILNAVVDALSDTGRQAFGSLLKQVIGAAFPGTGDTGFTPNTTASAFFSAIGGANDNYSKGAVTRAPLPDVGATRTGIPLSRVTAGNLTADVASNYADRFQGLLDDLRAAGYPIKSLGEGGYSFRKVAGSNNLSRHAFGEAIDINPRENPWSHVKQETFSRYGIDADDLASRNGLTWGGNWRKPDTMHFQVDKSVEMLGKRADATSMAFDRTTTQALSFGGGLSQLTQSLMSVGGGAGGGGWFSSLMSMFGGAGGATNFMTGISPRATAFLASGGVGLFASGTENAPAGWGWIGEEGPELRKLRSGDVIRSNPASMAMMQSGNGIANVRVYVDQDGNWQAKVESISKGVAGPIAKQEANASVGSYDYRQKQGGAAAADHRYQRLKRRA